MSTADVVERSALMGHATDRLRAAGLPAPELEVKWMMAASLAVPTPELWRVADVPAEVEQHLGRLVERRLRGVPLAYVLGELPFRHLWLLTDPRALIPRPETEGLVELVLASARSRWGEGAWGSVVDLGTGTGCIALALETEGAFCQVTAVDRSREALALARANAERVGADDVRFLVGDLLSAVGPEGCDMIVSNPPYLSEAEYDALDDSVRVHEPRTALVGGRSGDEMTATILAEAIRCVAPGGCVALEVDCERAAGAAATAEEVGWCDARVFPDLSGRPRYMTAIREGV